MLTQVFEEETIRPASAEVRLIEADIEAAIVEAEARSAAADLAERGGWGRLMDRYFQFICGSLADRDRRGPLSVQHPHEAFGDVVETASWIPDPLWEPPEPGQLLLTPGRCVLDPCSTPQVDPCASSTLRSP